MLVNDKILFRYRRDTTVCIGLPPYFKIVFEKNRKRKKVKTKPRYYQLDDYLLTTAHEVNFCFIVYLGFPNCWLLMLKLA